MKYIKFSYFFLLIFFFIGCAELDKIVKEIEIKPIKPNNTQKTSPKKTSPPKKAANTFIDFKKIFRQNAKEKATKTTAQQKVIPLNNLKVTDKVVIKDVFVYEGKTSRKSCENYFLFIEQTTKTELRSGNVRVTDNGKQCIYEAGAKKITHNKPTRRYKVYAQSSAKTDPESANPNNNYAFIFLSHLKPPSNQALNKYHGKFQNLFKGTKITIQAVVSSKKANLITQNSVKRASNINIFGDNIFYLTVLSWQVVK